MTGTPHRGTLRSVHPKLKAALLAGALAGLVAAAHAFIAALDDAPALAPLQPTDLPIYADAGAN